MNDQQLRDFTNQFLHIPTQPVLQHGSCSGNTELEDHCTVQNSRYALPEEPQNFTYTIINPAFSGSMRGVRVLRQLVPHHRSTVKVGTDCSLQYSDCSCDAVKGKGKGRYSSFWAPHLRATEHHLPYSVTCHPTQVNAPRQTPAMQAGTRFTYPGGMLG